MITLGLVVVLLLFSPKFLRPYDTADGQLVMAVIGGLFVGGAVGSRAVGPPRTDTTAARRGRGGPPMMLLVMVAPGGLAGGGLLLILRGTVFASPPPLASRCSTTSTVRGS